MGSKDLIALLKADHKEAEALLERFDGLDASDRDGYFCELVQTLVGHEVAEEVVVYPALREEAPNGDAVADARVAEQAEAEELLAKMEKLSTSSSEFVQKFEKLRKTVLAHAESEEATAFAMLEEATSAEQRKELGERYEKAKDSAPTHPHPHAPDSPPANTVVGPVAALFDRARDAVQKV